MEIWSYVSDLFTINSSKCCSARRIPGPRSLLSFYKVFKDFWFFFYKQETMYHWKKTSLNPKRFKFGLKLRSQEHQEYSEMKWISSWFFLRNLWGTGEDFSKIQSIFLKLVDILNVAYKLEML